MPAIAQCSLWLLLLSFVFQVNAKADDPPSLESKYLSNPRQVTEGFVKAGEGYFSPDAKTIIYQAVPKDYPFYQIYTQPLEGGRPRLVSTGRGRTTCSYFSSRRQADPVRLQPSGSDAYQTEAAERKRQAEDAASGQRRRYAVGLRPPHGHLRGGRWTARSSAG